MVTISRANDKKDTERRHLESFLDGLVDEPLLTKSERPDWWIEATDGSRFAVEVTEYRPRSPERGGSTRSTNEARWSNILQQMEPLRSQTPSLEGVHAVFRFKNGELPAQSMHKHLATDVVPLIAALATQADVHKVGCHITFLPKQFLAQYGNVVLELRIAGGCCACYRLPGPATSGRVFELVLAEEDWACLAGLLSSVTVERYLGIKWLPWTCLDVAAAFISPSGPEFRTILDDKAKKSRLWNLQGCPLWLLIVCDVPGDLSSHIYPSSRDDLTLLHQTVGDSGFDFIASPFDAVWLFSAARTARECLYSRSPQ